MDNNMTTVTPTNRPKRIGPFIESSSGESTRSSSRRVAQPKSYAESEDSDIINVSGSGAILDEVGSDEQEAQEDIECKCGSTQDDLDEAWICCDSCGIWQHLKCNGFDSDDEDEITSMRWLCEQCGPYGAVGASISPSEQASKARRSKNTNPEPAKGGRTKLDVRSYYTSSRDLSVKNPKKRKKKKRVSFSPATKPASESEDDEDGDRWEPPDEPASDGEEDEDGYHADENEDENSLFLATTPAPLHDAAPDYELAKTPRGPGVTDLGESIVKRWIEGGYSNEIDVTSMDGDEGSDVSAIDIPDMSEGHDLLEKLAEQDRLIFSMKAKLEKRGDRIAKLKREVEGLRGENEFLKGGGMVGGI